MGKFKKGNPGGPGRPKGSKNKFTTLRESFIEAYIKLGGTKGMVKWVKKNERNRAAFYRDLVRLIPQSQLTINEQKNLIMQLGMQAEQDVYKIDKKFLPKIKIESMATSKKSEEAVIAVLSPEDAEVIDIEPLLPEEIDVKIKELRMKKKKLEAKIKEQEN